MEEKKKTTGQQQEKLSYEELKKYLGELNQQNQVLAQQNRQMREMLEKRDFDYTSFFLSMLFKVMDHSDKYTYEFVDWCKKNIEAALTSFAQSTQESEEAKDEA